MVKLIVTDVDGTLLPEGRPDLNPAYLTVMAALMEKGVTVAVASGRPAASLREMFAPLVGRLWILSQNGSVLEHGDRRVVPHPLPAAAVRELWDELSRYPGADCLLNTAEHSYVPRTDSEMARILREGYHYTVRPADDWAEIAREGPTMLSLFCPPGQTQVLRERLTAQWTGRLQVLPAGERWIDFVAPESGKGGALRALCREVDIEPRDVTAFGDNSNDLSMLTLAGTGVTVETAKPEVKAAVQKIVPGCAENGVLRELERILAELP